jgi:hypothetical protein
MAKPRTKELRTLESNLQYIRTTYRRLILENTMKGKSTNRLVERLKAIEIQLWMVREDGQRDAVSNGS